MTFRTKYIICVKFCGLNFFGSQKQKDKRTVQGEIENALRTLTKQNINTIFSGRTDKDVSAKHQVVHFELNSKIENLDKFKYSLNSILPSDVKVFEIMEVKPNFHAQKNAIYKHYRYTILNDQVASVFQNLYLYYPYKKLNIKRINNSLSHLIGHHDFRSFSSKSDNPYFDCKIFYANSFEKYIDNQRYVYVDIIGNRFLYNMVRTIIGQILFIERNELNHFVMKEVLEAKDRSKAKNVIEAKGLCLEFVGYDNINSYIEKINSLKEGK